jgi:hypothetical protein
MQSTAAEMRQVEIQLKGWMIADAMAERNDPPGEGADSSDVARSFRDHVARCSDMMSPA